MTGQFVAISGGKPAVHAHLFLELRIMIAVPAFPIAVEF